jgi:protein-disulfide isomerase/uncharacterized membrane protein
VKNSQYPSKFSNMSLWIASISTFIAILVHSYLAKHHYDLKFGEVTSTSLCNINSTFNCEAASASKFSELFGIPMAIWGAFTNTALLALIAFRPLFEPEKQPALRRALLLMSGFVAATSLVMLAISAFILSTFCPFCMGAYVLSFITFAGLWYGLPDSALLSPLQAKIAAPAAMQPVLMPLVIAAIFIGLGSLITNDQIKTSYNATGVTDFVRSQMQEWSQNPVQTIQTVSPLVEGAEEAKAKMKIVEFADFRCGHCKHAAPVLNAFVSSHPDVRLEFQAWPLDGECNTSIPTANGASCLLARAVFCAEKLKQSGWKAHAYVFEHQEEYATVDAVKAALASIAAAAGAGAPELTACSDDPETKALIQKQAAVGTALNLKGTPGIYVNGKELAGGQSLPVLTEAYRSLTQ